MQSWFREKPVALPSVVDSPPDEPPGEAPDGYGVVTIPGGVEAALLLRSSEGDVHRVSWEKVKGREVPGDRRRAIPAGVYRVLGVSLVDRSRKGEVWHTSSSGRQLGEIDVDEGEELAFAPDPTISIRRGLRGERAAMGITSPAGAGLSIYKDGRRIPISYRLTTGDERAAAKGRMNYG